MRLRILASNDFKVGKSAWYFGGVFSFPKARSFLGFGSTGLPDTQLEEVYQVCDVQARDTLGAVGLGGLVGLATGSAAAGLLGTALGLVSLTKSVCVAYLSFSTGQRAIVQLDGIDLDKLASKAKITGQISESQAINWL